MLLQIADSNSFLWLNNVPLYVQTFVVVHLIFSFICQKILRLLPCVGTLTAFYA